jgi:hypothetical protein
MISIIGASVAKFSKTALWIREHLDYTEDDCLIWPFFRDANGYGRVKAGTTIGWAHRVICELRNGPAPLGHEAAHSCGNGRRGCVNPRHLSWKTRRENQLDRRRHGTKAAGAYRWSRSKLKIDQVREIRRLRGLETQRAIADRFGVTDATIRDIYSGKSWRNA